MSEISRSSSIAVRVVYSSWFDAWELLKSTLLEQLYKRIICNSVQRAAK